MKQNLSSIKPHGRVRSRLGSVRNDKRTARRRASSFSLDASTEIEPRHRASAQAADLCAEQRGFHDGTEFRHWLEVEAEIDSILMR